MTSKSHFIAVARIIAAERAEQIQKEATAMRSPDKTAAFSARVTAERLARRLADVYANENPRFDSARFFEACGMEG